MLDLTRVRSVLDEVQGVVDDLDGRCHEDRGGVREPKTIDRHERAALSRQLQFLATRLELGAALVRSEYWAAKGYPDHINPDED